MLDFYIPFMILTIIITTIFSLIYTLSTKKFYSIFYILAMLTYINFTAYIIDAFDMTKNGIIITFFLSSILMMLIGTYFNQKNTKKTIKITPKQSITILIICLIITLSLFSLNMISPKIITKEKIIKENLNKIYKQTPEEYYNFEQINILKLELKNEGFIPKVQKTNNYHLCLNNQVQRLENYDESYIEIPPKSTKTITYQLEQIPKPENKNKVILKIYKTDNNYYYMCDELNKRFKMIYNTTLTIKK